MSIFQKGREASLGDTYHIYYTPEEQYNSTKYTRTVKKIWNNSLMIFEMKNPFRGSYVSKATQSFLVECSVSSYQEVRLLYERMLYFTRVLTFEWKQKNRHYQISSLETLIWIRCLDKTNYGLITCKFKGFFKSFEGPLHFVF